jgi:hypothetical protein
MAGWLSWALLGLVAHASNADRGALLRIESGPLFYPESGCGRAAFGLWSPEIRGCFRPEGISIENKRAASQSNSPAALRASLQRASLRLQRW